MGSRSCDNCMVKRRGDCFGGSPCSDYKAVPSVSDAERSNWPVVMRSNSQSRHLEWKKEQERRAKLQPPKTKIRRTVKASNLSTRRTNKESVMTASNALVKTPKPEYSISYLQNKYNDSILVWVLFDKTVHDEYYGRYLLEYQGRCRSGIVKSKTLDQCLYDVMKSVSERVVDNSFNVVMIPSISLEKIKENSYMYDAGINEMLIKGIVCRMEPHPRLKKEIREYIKDHQED